MKMAAGLLTRLVGRLEPAHPNHRKIAIGAFWVGILVLAAKVCVAAREIAIAWRYGIGSTADAFQLAFTLTTWLPMLLIGVGTAVLVPRLVSLRSDPQEYSSLVEELNGTVVLVAAAVSVAIYVLSPLIVAAAGSGLSHDTRDATLRMTLYMAPVAFLYIIGGYFSIRLQARERYGYSFAEALPAISIVLMVVALPSQYTHGPLIWGCLVGFGFQAVLLAYLVRRGDPPIRGLSFKHRSSEWGMIYGPLFIMGVGQFTLTATIPIDQLFASRLGDGFVATLGYANRVIGLITTLGHVVLARALLPVLSSVAAQGDLKLGQQQTLRWSWLMMGLALGVAAAAWIAAPMIVQVLFQRGAFSVEDTTLVAAYLKLGLLQMPAFFGGIVLVQWLLASGRYKSVVLASFAALVTKLLLNFALVKEFGGTGIMLATAGMYTVNFLVLLFFVRSDGPQAGRLAAIG